MSELEDIRQKRMRELQLDQMRQQSAEQQIQNQQMEQQIGLIMRQVMTSEARDRLANIRMARPDFARQIELLLIQLYQNGRLKQLDDKQLKALLVKISGTKRETTIQMR
jgi:programmed cell death protein 5